MAPDYSSGELAILEALEIHSAQGLFWMEQLVLFQAQAEAMHGKICQLLRAKQKTTEECLDEVQPGIAWQAAHLHAKFDEAVRLTTERVLGTRRVRVV